MSKGSDSPPPAPDYAAAADQTAAANKEALTAQTWANRPDQNTPWGSTFWTTGQQVDPATGQPVTTWTQNEQLDPALQSALNDQLAIQQGRSDLAGGFMGRVADEYSQPFNWSNLPGMSGTPQAQFTYGRNLDTQYNNPLTSGYERVSPMTSGYERVDPTTGAQQAPEFLAERQRIEQGLFDRMAPQHQQAQDQLATQLANQGLTPGSEGWTRAMTQLGDQQSRERFNALEMGGNEQARQQQMLLGQQQQAFGQRLGAGQFGLGAQQQAFGQQLGAGQFGLGAQAQAFGQRGTAQEAYNRAQQQLFSQDMGANAQNFQQMQAQADYQNKLRQQAITEQAMARGMSLNEMNALLTGQQVQTPGMPAFMGSGMAQAPNYLNAAQMQYGAGADAFNAQQAQQQSQNAGLYSLGGAAMTAAAVMF